MTHEEPDREEPDVDGFLRTWFCKLPWLALEMIFSHKQLRYEYSSLLQVPKLRSFWVWHFRSRTIMLCPKAEQQEPQFEWDPSNSDVCFDNNEEIAAFFLDYPDILPNRFVVAVPKEIAVSCGILQKFRRHIARAPKLEVWLKNKNLSAEDLDILFQFQNLSKFKSIDTEFDALCETLSRKLMFRTNLRKLQFSACKFPPSASVHLPPDLESLHFSVRHEKPTPDVMSPSSELISQVFPGGTNAHTAVFQQLAHPETLEDLWIRNVAGISVDFSLLPPALKSFTLSGKYWDVNEGPISPWPQTLTSIKVSFASERGSREIDLLPAKWPSRLKELHLNGPWLRTLDVLATLPPTIEDLQIENAGIDTLDVFDNGEYYSYQNLLPALKSLKFRECPNIDWELFKGEDEEYFPPRIVFPPGLKYLEISNCGLEDLSYLEFPVSLRVLNLSSNRISNLDTYESYEGDDESIHWNALINLRDLFVQRNEIDTLEYWCPPRSSVKLYLSYNRLQTLTAWETPLFDIRYSKFTENLDYLDIRGNRLSKIESNLHIPSNLSVLELSENLLRDFQFIDSIASHEKLQSLSLRQNPIRAISLPSPRYVYASSLKEINLYLTHGTDDCCWQEDDELDDYLRPEYENTFYGVLEQLGLKNIKRDKYATVHYFH